MEKVHVDRRLLVGLAGVAGASLLAVAFLLGKASSSGPVAAPAAGPTAQENAPPSAAPLREPEIAAPSDVLRALPAATAPAPPAEPVTTFEPPLRSASPAVAPPPAAGPVPSDPARPAVAAYLEAVARIQPGQMQGDAESVANGLAVALAKGDASGLEKLIRETEEARARLATLTPPAECASHYRESLGSLDDGLEMLRSLKTAMESPDPAAGLAEVGTRATALRSRAEALQRAEQALRERYDLPR